MDHLLPFATCLQFGELFGKLVSKGTRNEDLESVQGSQMERERILSEQRDIHDFLERKAHQAHFSEARSEFDRREWRMQNVDVALHEAGMQLQSHRMELYQANQLIDQTRRETSCLCDDLETRNRAFQKDRARNCQ